MTTIFAERSRDALRRFVDLWASVLDPSLDRAKAVRLAEEAARYYRASKKGREGLRELQALERRWYASIASGTPDYSVYDDEYILSDIWSSWVGCSRRYLLALRSPRSLGERTVFDDLVGVRRVVDLGCGFGYSTAALKELFPEAEVYGTQLAGGRQWRLAAAVGEERGFGLAPRVDRPSELVFASEYFEHIERPIEHLTEVLDRARPRYLVVANAFGAKSVGHFPEYQDGARRLSPAETSRLFGRTLRERGFENVATSFWNRRPSYWRLRDDTCTGRLF